MEEALLGIDIGTSSGKVGIFDRYGRILASGTVRFSTVRREADQVEQDPEEWWGLTSRLIRELLDSEAMRDVRVCGVGVDAQGWSMIPVDTKGNMLFPNMIWMDTRSEDICRRYRREIGDDRIFEVCGNQLGGGYSLPKILWLREWYPDIFEKIHTVLQANSYIVYRLTGRFTQDVCQSYAYQCFDNRRGDWDRDLMHAFGLSEQLFPEISPCDAVVGTVTKKASELTGLKEGTPVVAGGLDAACAALGIGVIADGEAQEQGGQAEGMSICTGSYAADPRLILSRHVVPGYWLLQGGTVGGGGAVDWARNLFLSSEAEKPTVYAEMDRMSASVPAGAEGVVFLPYMRGERSPIWDPYAKGVFYGLDFSKTRAHMIRAVQEGIAFSLRHNLEVAERAGCKVDTLWAAGGSAKSGHFLQIKADITGKKMCVAASDMGAAQGAALLAGVGTGFYSSYKEAKEQVVHLDRTFAPRREEQAVYDVRFGQYLELYQSLKGLMERS